MEFTAAGSNPYNLYFAKATCGLWVDACFTWVGTQADSTRQANYLLTAEIRLTLAQYRLTNLGIEDMLRHEIGHWIGLDDQYKENSTRPCSNVVSVMNDSYRTTGLNCKDAHAPTAWDIDAVTTYWKYGAVERATLEESSTRLLEVEWVDAMWAESEHRLYLWYWDSSDESWVMAENTRYTYGTGFHKDSIARDMGYSWHISGSGRPTDKWYIVGVRAWSAAWQTWSPIRFSNLVYVD